MIARSISHPAESSMCRSRSPRHSQQENNQSKTRARARLDHYIYTAALHRATSLSSFFLFPASSRYSLLPRVKSAMSYHGGDTFQQPSCTTVPLGKTVRRALRAAIGMPKPKKKKPPGGRDDGPAAAGGGSSMTCSSLSKEEAAARKESVVRVVLSSGVVEVYPCVVLACAVIRRHPPGLCLAHPDVFRNPHGALLRPLEPLFPGQKVLLIPWSTFVKLKQRIPESSIGAFSDEEDTAGSEEAPSSSSTETEAQADLQDHSGGGVGDEEAAGDGGSSSGGFMPACSARDYFEARDRWSACRFRRLVEQGIAVEPSTDDDHQPAADLQRNKAKKTAKKKGKTKKKGHKKKRRERRPAAPPAGLTTQRRTWEPSLPSVEEEEEEEENVVVVSPLQSPAASTTDARDRVVS